MEMSNNSQNCGVSKVALMSSYMALLLMNILNLGILILLMKNEQATNCRQKNDMTLVSLLYILLIIIGFLTMYTYLKTGYLFDTVMPTIATLNLVLGFTIIYLSQVKDGKYLLVSSFGVLLLWLCTMFVRFSTSMLSTVV